MKNKKIIPFLMQLPLVLIISASFIGSIYAVINKIGEISIAVPIILGISIAVYFYGRYLENKSRKESGF